MDSASDPLHSSFYTPHRKWSQHSAWTSNPHRFHRRDGERCPIAYAALNRGDNNRLVFRLLPVAYTQTYRQVHPHLKTRYDLFSSVTQQSYPEYRMATTIGHPQLPYQCQLW